MGSNPAGRANLLHAVARGDYMLEHLRREDFEPLLGQMLAVEAATSATQLEVKEVSALHGPTPRPVPPFRVILRSRSGWQVKQGLLRVRHPELGALELFAVPIGPDGEGLCYEIIFN